MRAERRSGARICRQENRLEAASIDNPLRKSSSACFPASCAARCDRNPSSRSLTPIGRHLRRISQSQLSGLLPVRETTT
jgi:hypothetical protein